MTTKATPHAHWAPFDEKSEMAVLDSLQAKLEAGEDFLPEAAKLADMSQSYGYGQADGFLSDFGTQDPELDDGSQTARREVYDDYMEHDEYWSYIDRSEKVLVEAAPNYESAKLVRAAMQGMRDGFEVGRKMRTEETAPRP